MKLYQGDYTWVTRWVKKECGEGFRAGLQDSLDRKEEVGLEGEALVPILECSC
jgi:hypothetical protein